MARRFTSRREIELRRSEPRKFVEATDENGDVWLVGLMSGNELDEWNFNWRDEEAGRPAIRQMHGFLLFLCLVDEQGQRLYTNHQEIAALGAIPGMKPVFDKALQVNGLGPAAVEDAKKNSGPTPPSDSNSTSASNGAAPTPSSSPA